MLVITIIGILATIALPMYQGSVIKSKEAALSTDLFNLRVSIDKYYADHGEYPPSIASLAEKRYIRSVPIDPFTKARDTWVEVSGTNGKGVFDIRSGSALVGTNGIHYNEW